MSHYCLVLILSDIASKVHDLTKKMLRHAVTVGISAHELHNIIYVYVNYSLNFITVHG